MRTSTSEGYAQEKICTYNFNNSYVSNEVSNELLLMSSSGIWFQIGIVLAINEYFKGFFFEDMGISLE